MNDYNRQHQSPERRVPAIDNRLYVVANAVANVNMGESNTPYEASARQTMFRPSHQAAPAPVSNIVEFPERTHSLPADNRSTVPTMPLPEQPAMTGEVVDMDQYRMAQEARERLNAA